MIANTEQVAEAVHRGDADLGFVEGEVNDPLLAIRKMEGDSLRSWLERAILGRQGKDHAKTAERNMLDST